VSVRRPFRSVIRNPRGVATIEFALWSVLIFGGLIPGLEIANYLIASNRLSAAMGQASLLVYNLRASETIDAVRLGAYINAAAALPGAAVTTTIACNGGAQSCAVPVANRQCSCVGTGLPTAYVVASSCSATCPGGATPGFYLTTAARYRYAAAIVGDPWLDGRILTRSVTVRLQ